MSPVPAGILFPWLAAALLGYFFLRDKPGVTVGILSDKRIG